MTCVPGELQFVYLVKALVLAFVWLRIRLEHVPLQLCCYSCNMQQIALIGLSNWEVKNHCQRRILAYRRIISSESSDVAENSLFFLCCVPLLPLCHLQVSHCTYEGCTLGSDSPTLHMRVAAWAGLGSVVIQQNHVLCKLGFLCGICRRQWNCVQCQRKAFSIKPFLALTLVPQVDCFCKDA